MLMLSLSLSASAVSLKTFNSSSTFKPVSYSDHKSVSSVTLYGNADHLCMKAYKDTKETQVFMLEVYSDSKRTKKVLEYSNDYKKGTKYTYYVKTYNGSLYSAASSKVAVKKK